MNAVNVQRITRTSYKFNHYYRKQVPKSAHGKKGHALLSTAQFSRNKLNGFVLIYTRISEVVFQNLKSIEEIVSDRSLLWKKSVCFNCSKVSETKNTENKSRDGKPSAEQLENIYLKLTADVPKIFIHHDYSMYDNNLIFEDNIRGLKTVGLRAYIQNLTLLKLYLFAKYTSVRVSILKITRHPEDSSVRIRWRIAGYPGLSRLFFFWRYKFWNMNWKDVEWTDGFSIVFVNDKGMIYKHICDKIIPEEEKSQKTNPIPGIATKLALIAGLTADCNSLF